MRVLVTGAAGFIGSHITRRLCDEGHKVLAIDDLSGGWQDNVDPRATFRKLDLTDWRHLQAEWRIFEPDVVYHMAAYAAEGLSHWVRGFNYTNNLVGSAHVVDCALEFGGRIVFASSMAVYGDQDGPFTEDMDLKPCDPYGIAKAAVEQDLAVAAETHGLRYTIVRPHNVYGPGQNLGDPYRNVVGIFMRQIMADEPMTVFGDGLQTRAFSYVDDVVEAILRADAQGEAFNVGGDERYTILDLAVGVADAFGVDARIRHLPERHEVKHAWCDHAKAKRELGFTPSTTLDVGLRVMAEWAQTAGVRWSQTPRIEVRKGLPEAWR